MRCNFGSVVIGALLTATLAEEWTPAHITEDAAERALAQGQTCVSDARSIRAS